MNCILSGRLPGQRLRFQRFNTTQYRWDTPLLATSQGVVLCIATDGTDLIIGTEGDGVTQMQTDGTIINTWETSDGLSANEVSAME